MIGVVGQVRRSVDSIREWIIKDLIRRQKVELDRKIDEMLKPPKVNRIMLKYLGVGKNVGGKMGGYVGRGLSLLRRLL
jgi:hypothetical protein